jgi:FeS assembly SUF system protein
MMSNVDMNKPNASVQVDATPTSKASLRQRVEAVLRSVYDPEIPVNICELGLIYGLEISAEGAIDIKMTLTAPNCPAAGAMPAEVETKIRAIEGVIDAHVELVWDPPWDKSRMSEAARLELGLM